MPTKLESPHAELQSLLPWLAVLKNGKHQERNMFRTQAEADIVCQTLAMRDHREWKSQPIWHVRHDDLLASEVKGWIVVTRTN
jgi:streptomycin 6-kinase